MENSSLLIIYNTGSILAITRLLTTRLTSLLLQFFEFVFFWVVPQVFIAIQKEALKLVLLFPMYFLFLKNFFDGRQLSSDLASTFFPSPPLGIDVGYVHSLLQDLGVFPSKTFKIYYIYPFQFTFALVLVIVAFSPIKLLAFYEHEDLKFAVGDWILMVFFSLFKLNIIFNKKDLVHSSSFIRSSNLG